MILLMYLAVVGAGIAGGFIGVTVIFLLGYLWDMMLYGSCVLSPWWWKHL